MKELRIPTRRTNAIHNETPENIIFLLLDQPSGEANATGTPIINKNEIAIKANILNWKTIVIFFKNDFCKINIFYINRLEIEIHPISSLFYHLILIFFLCRLKNRMTGVRQSFFFFFENRRSVFFTI